VDNIDPHPQYKWSNIEAKLNNFVVLHNDVLSFNSYLLINPAPIPNDPIDAFIRKTKNLLDITILISKNPAITNEIVKCMTEKYYAGNLAQETPVCMITIVFLQMLFIIIGGILLIKFFMALFFAWFASEKLSRLPKVFKNPYLDVNPPVSLYYELQPPKNGVTHGGVHLGVSELNRSLEGYPPQPFESDLYTVLLVTCYSEGEESIRNTLDSLALTLYDDRKKLLFVIADGLVKVYDLLF
jgi:chitin synthase